MKRRAVLVAALLLAVAPPRAADAAGTDAIAPGPALPIVRWGDLERDEPNAVTTRFAYRRVDGAAVHVGYRYHDPTRRRPQLHAELGYATEREAGLWTLEVRQPLFAGRRVTVGAGAWRATRSFEFDDEIVGSTENTLAALWMKQDYRDHYDGRGGRLFARGEVTDKYALSAALLVEEQRALATRTDWAVFGPDAFRENPAAAEGTLRATAITLSHDSRPRGPDHTAPFIGEVRRSNRDWVRLTYEAAGGALGGDFDYGFVRLDARGYWKLTPTQFLAARLLGGRAVHGRLPAQKAFFAGGVGTLRGHSHKADRGDRVLLANVEYSIDLYRAVQGVLFGDIGRAWDSARHDTMPRAALDGGFGLQTRDQRLRLLVARDLRRERAPLLVSVRTTATF
jgi:outer membrane protein assembly factor BamA